MTSDRARYFILGTQGLWPERRWRGLEGAAQAMRTMEYLPLDQLKIIARSQRACVRARNEDTSDPAPLDRS